MWQETKLGLYKRYTFKDFKQAFAFMEQVAALAESMQHHPRWENEWNTVQIWLRTHEAQSLITNKDWAFSRAIDALELGGLASASQKPAKHHHYVKLYSDGGSRGNPGPSAAGYVLLTKDDEVIVDDGEYLGVTTNNQAEYMALKLALVAAQRVGAREVDCYLDSMLVVNQMRGIYKIKNRDLWPVHEAIKKLMQNFDLVHFQHVPREQNTRADASVNRILNQHLQSE